MTIIKVTKLRPTNARTKAQGTPQPDEGLIEATMPHELHSDELEQLYKKRELLEQLLAFTKQIIQMGNGLDLVREMAKPSQRVNKRLFKLLLALIERLTPLETEELKSRLTTIDGQIQKELRRMLVLSRMSEDEFMQHFTKSSTSQLSATYDALQQEIESFRRLAQTNVAIRYVLSQRGALIDACSLPISQEALGETVETLRAKETECKQRVERKIEDMINDTDLILSCDKYPEELKEQLRSVRKNLVTNLERLHSGESVAEVFVSIDAFEISDDNADTISPNPEPPQTDPHPATADKTPDAEGTDETDEEEVSEKTELDLSQLPRAFVGIALWFHDINTWLRSPWQVSWRSIRARSRLRSKQFKRQRH